MNAKQFGDKYGKKHIRKIPKWYAAGYLGNATKDEKTGIYTIPDDIPLPYDAHRNVTKLPTLWKEIFTAAESTKSMFSSMYPKLPTGVFDRQIQNFAEAGFISVSYTASGDPYLELLQPGYEYMTSLSEGEKSNLLVKVNKAVMTGCTITQAFVAVWPYIQAFLIK